VVVPVIYTYLDRFFEWHKARRTAREARRAAQIDVPASGD